MLKIPSALQTQFAQNVIAGNKVNDLANYTGPGLSPALGTTIIVTPLDDADSGRPYLEDPLPVPALGLDHVAFQPAPGRKDEG